MPITDKLTRGLTEAQKEKLVPLLDEANRRGIDVSKLVQSFQKPWPIGSNGYFVRRDGKIYIPKGEQENFIQSTARFSLFRGGRGSGKTAAGAQKALLKIMKGESGAVLNPVFEDFKDSTWPEFREWIPWDMVVIPDRFRGNPEWEPYRPFQLSFTNRVNVICKGLNNPDSARGPNINWLWFDEGAREVTGLSWKIAIASTRVGDNPQAWATTTPRGKFNWVYEFFEELKIPPEIMGILEDLGYDENNLIETFEGSIDENKENLDPLFYASLVMAYSDDPYFRKQELEGKYVEQGGVLGDSNWFNEKIIEEVPEEVKYWVRYWDLAASEPKISKGKKRTDPDYTCGTKMGWDGKEDFYISDQVNGRWEWDDILNKILDTAIRDGPYVKIRIEQEPGSGGINQVAAIKKFIQEKIPGAPFDIEGHKPQGDKIQRANVWFGDAKRGHIWIVDTGWDIEGFYKQLDSFPPNPKKGHDDRIDSVSGARYTIAPIVSWSSPEFLKI
jgi:predicted phage terminase large subunit-like protein